MTVTTEIPDSGPTRLLVLAEDTVAVNRMISALRHEGIVLQPVLAGDLKEAARLLQQDAPDLVVVFESPRLSPDAVLDLLHKHELSPSLVLVSPAPPADAELPAWQGRGVAHIARPDQPGLLTSLLLEEIHNCAQRRHLSLLEFASRELEQRHRQLLDQSPLAISYLRDGMHLYCNASYAAIFGYPTTDAVSATPLLNLVTPEQRSSLKSLLESARLSRQGATFQVRQHNDSEMELHFDFSPVRYHGKDCLQLTVHPAAGNTDYASELARLAEQDLLTSLDSRAHFLNRIEAAIRQAIQHEQVSTLIVLEIDDFDDIVATIGRSAANHVLNDIAEYLRTAIDIPFHAGRLDSNCFGILVEESDPDVGLALCKRIQGSISNRISGAMLATLSLGCSAGMVLVNGHALAAADLVEKAALMRRRLPAGHLSPTQYRIGESLESDTGDMLEYLRTALETRRFKPVFQPIVGLGKQQRHCYELLIRMLDLDDNEIPPGDFIPLASINGLGEALDRMVTSIAFEALLASARSHQLNVNITDNTLLSHTFLPWLSEKLRSSRLAADRLLLDISEISLHSLREQTLAFCKGLDALGVRITISDFGCALDPLATLDLLRPTFVTLDASLVRDLVYSARDKARVKSLVDLLHASGLEVAIPRVENMAALPLLWELGADYVQGFSVQAPSHAMDFEFVQDQEITLAAPRQ